jgi:hypothetical protein
MCTMDDMNSRKNDIVRIGRVPLVGVTLLALALGAGNSACADANSPATTAATTTAPTAGEAEMKILRDLEAAGDKYRTIKADLDYEIVNLMLGDSEKRTGWVAYSKGDEKTPTRFRVSFATLQLGAGAKTTNEKIDYAFDGQWLTVAKHKIKNITLYQLAAKGQKLEALRIGKGPFPLPFGQSAADMVKYFKPTTRPPVESDPKDTIYLRLTTRPEHLKDMPTTRMEMWIDAKTHLPVKLKSRDKDRNTTTVMFKKIQTNKAVDEKAFRIPHPIGYEVIRSPMNAGRAVAP